VPPDLDRDARAPRPREVDGDARGAVRGERHHGPFDARYDAREPRLLALREEEAAFLVDDHERAIEREPEAVELPLRYDETPARLHGMDAQLGQHQPHGRRIATRAALANR
jgi:hypothetical protein